MQRKLSKPPKIKFTFGQKVTLYAVCVSLLALAIFGGSFIFYDVRETQKGLVSTLELQADIIANNALEALIRGDKDKAFEIIDAIGSEEYIKGAWLYDHEGQVFSQYDPNRLGDTELTPTQNYEPQFENQTLTVKRPILVGDKSLGTIVLKSSLQGLYHRFIFQLSLVIAGIIVALSGAFLLAYKLQKTLTTPLNELINTVKLVMHTSDYSYRAQRLSRDDLGMLTNAFNQMLHHVETTNEALKSNEERLHLALWGADEVIFDWDAHSDQLYFDNAVEASFGYQENDVPQTLEEYIRLIHPDDIGAFQNALFSHLKGSSAHFESEHRLQNGDGVFRWVLMRGKVVERNKRGEPLRLTGIVGDVTEKRQAQEEIKLFHKVFSSTTEAVVIMDDDLRIVQCNKAFNKITGFSLEAVKGSSLEILYSQKHATGFYNELRQHLEQEGHWQGEVRQVRRSGEEFPSHLSLNIMKDDQGRPTHFVGVFADLTAEKRREDKVKYLTHFDPLTNLPNRILLLKNLEKLAQYADQASENLGLMMVGIDNFKLINDSFGNVIGDELLKQVSARLLGFVDSKQHIARTGGDEFALIFENIKDVDSLKNKASEILYALSKQYNVQDVEMTIGACIGISVFSEDCENVESLIINADTAMLHAKREDRNTFHAYMPFMNEDITERQKLESQLRHAIDREELKLVYQPKIDAQSGRIIGCEALLRWHQSEHGLINTEKFIALAEETGLIVSIGEWALRQACLQGLLWHQQGWTTFKIAINVSGAQFKRDDFAQRVEKVLHETGFPSHLLEIEITEGALVANIEQCIEVLNKLRSMGVNISVDDFGTGYSSLSYLKRLPIDTLKIDQSFVKDMLTNPDDENIIQAIVAMAHSLHLQTVAEGVESLKQSERLKALGCDILQGYYYSQPLYSEAFYAFCTGPDHSLADYSS